MRMTNKIMQNNSLYNINNNKQLQDKLSTQMATQKKITRPSDDPVIAIRALRLRSDVSQIKQYYGKNAPDAESWLKVTSDALETTTEVLKSMTEQAGKGSNKDLGVEDLEIIITQLKALKDEFYSTGNVDFAGRYVFTGYRTDTTLTYTENTTQDFTITELFDISSLDTLNYTNIGDLKGMSKDTYDPTANTGHMTENDIKSADIQRIMLSYDNLKAAAAGQEIKIQKVAAADTDKIPPLDDTVNNDLVPAGDIEVISKVRNAAGLTPYDLIQTDAYKDKAILVPETGELLLGSGLYESKFKTLNAEDKIMISYEKDSWKEGDLRPQHYFACKDETAGIEYNYAKYNDAGVEKSCIACENESQIIEYDVGYNQKIRVNTNASDVFTMDMDRAIDDLENALASLKEINASKVNLKNMLDGKTEGEAGYDKLAETYAAAEKAFTSIRENMQRKFEGFITKVQDISANTNTAITDSGTRASRLDLITNRLMTQKSTFETLQAANEDVDVTEVTIQLTSMENSYQSALLATGKILQNSLMNYI